MYILLTAFMKIKSLKSINHAYSVITVFLLMGISVAADARGAYSDPSNKVFSPDQQRQIGEIAAMYIAQHPEYLIAAQETLRQNQIIAQKNSIISGVSGVSKNLYHSINSPFLGPDNARVVVVFFTDYFDGKSLKTEGLLNSIKYKHPDVKLIYKEFPLTVNTSPVAGVAAVIAQKIWNEKGSSNYFLFRNKIYEIKSANGLVSEQDVLNAGKMAGVNLESWAKKDNVEKKQINTNLKLGQDLGITMTPTIIVGPQEGETKNGITVFTSSPSEAQLEQAINLAEKQK